MIFLIKEKKREIIFSLSPFFTLIYIHFHNTGTQYSYESPPPSLYLWNILFAALYISFC